jgi:uncharacterized protein (TIGR02646 family)
MRRFRRLEFDVPTMSPAGPGGLTRQRHIELYSASGVPPVKFPDHWTRPDVRGILLAMQGRVCAYCGMATKGLDIDHFRPKGPIRDDPDHVGYWWLAYDCGNYFLACGECNRNRKSTRFPLAQGALRTTWESRADLRLEPHILPDVVDDDVEALFELDSSDLSCELEPGATLVSTEKARAQQIIDFFNLNHDPETRRQRIRVADEARTAARDKNWAKLRRMAMRHREHSLVAVSILRENAPEELPRPEDELRDIVEMRGIDLHIQIAENLKLKDRGKEPGDQNERTLQSICWALKILEFADSSDFVVELKAELFALENNQGMRSAILQALAAVE